MTNAEKVAAVRARLATEKPGHPLDDYGVAARSADLADLCDRLEEAEKPKGRTRKRRLHERERAEREAEDRDDLTAPGCQVDDEASVECDGCGCVLTGNELCGVDGNTGELLCAACCRARGVEIAADEPDGDEG